MSEIYGGVPRQNSIPANFTVRGRLVRLLHFRKTLAVLTVALVGSIAVIITHAATNTTVAVLPQASITPPTGNAQVVSDSSAISGRAVEFGITPPSGGGGTGTASGCTTATGAIAPCMSGTGSGSGTNGYGAPAFDDEFSGTSLDASSWVAGRREGGTSVCTSDCGGYNPSYESELFEPSAVSVANGSLVITATKKSPDGGQHSWTSGAVEMKPGKNFVYGYFEARVKVPAPTQAWTAYWLTGANTWPPEMDIFEFHFYKGQPTFNNDGLPGTQGANLSGWPDSEAYGGTNTDFTQWHTYGLLWTSNSIKVYFDGVLQNIDTSDTGIPSTSMYPLFDYAIDGTSANPPSGSQMDVDYMRIWCPSGGTSCMTAN